MHQNEVRKVMVLDQGHPVFYQLLCRAKELFGSADTEYVRLDCSPSQMGEAAMDHMAVIAGAAQVIRQEKPDLVLIGATSLGEEVAPALGVRLGSGVAAHCTQISVTEEGRIAYMVPAFGGRVIGEILIPREQGGAPAIATVKPGMFEGSPEEAGSFRSVGIPHAAGGGESEGTGEPETGGGRPEAGEWKGAGSVRLLSASPVRNGAEALDKAKLIFCGGFGIGSEENWNKIEELARRTGGAAGCTRPVVDMGWGPDESRMIGTSGRTVKPKVYVGFGISGAAHHLCGIQDADVIISINNDREAEVFAASDYAGVFDASKIIDALLERVGD